MSFQGTNSSPTLGSMYISFPIIGTIKIVIPQKTDNPAVSKNIFLVFFLEKVLEKVQALGWKNKLIHCLLPLLLAIYFPSFFQYYSFVISLSPKSTLSVPGNPALPYIYFFPCHMPAMVSVPNCFPQDS